MKYVYPFFIIPVFLFFSYQNELKKEPQTNDKIHLNIQNIPVVQHKISTGKNSYRTDKSPVVSYKLKNNYKSYPVKYSTAYKNLTQVFDHDTLYLRLRYNPGKEQTFILRRGDSAIIEYFEGKPYIEIINREVKKHDSDISDVLARFKRPLYYFEFFQKKSRIRTEKEKKEAHKKFIKVYSQQLNLLDSLVQNDLLSQAEYEYNRNTIVYLKEGKSEKFNLNLLKAKDLHINSYQQFIKQYVFLHLKKKIISIANGMARNSLEAFDYALASSDFSPPNKYYLLYSYLKNIKTDFPISKFNTRYATFKSLVSNKNSTSELDNEFRIDIKSIYNKINKVTLVDSKNDQTTLDKILKKYKGKVVYIDFWASWCAPCRASFPNYKVLKSEYKNKDIEFVFISIDKDEEDWKQAEIEEGLENSTLALNYPFAKLYQDLKLKRIPRYLVFDRSGKLAHLNAPGPESEEIRSLIDALLLK